MKDFTIDNNGIIITDSNGDAVFVPTTYLSIFAQEIGEIGTEATLDKNSTIGFLNLIFIPNGVYIADDKEDVFVSKQDADRILEALSE